MHLDFVLILAKKHKIPWDLRQLKTDHDRIFLWLLPPKTPQVKNVFDQEGFSRQKRGYRNINDIEVNMSDPLFTKQWYLVSNQPGSCRRAGLDLSDPGPHSSALITRKSAIFPATPRINNVIHSLISRPSGAQRCIRITWFPPLLFTLTGNRDFYAAASPSSFVSHVG